VISSQAGEIRTLPWSCSVLLDGTCDNQPGHNTQGLLLGTHTVYTELCFVEGLNAGVEIEWHGGDIRKGFD
jgi:hypothetical protein